MEVDVVPGKLSFIRLITTKSNFSKEEGNHLITDQKTDLDIRGKGGVEIHGIRGEVGSPILGVAVGLKVKVEDETDAVEIVHKWKQRIMVSNRGKQCVHSVKIQFPLKLGSATRS